MQCVSLVMLESIVTGKGGFLSQEEVGNRIESLGLMHITDDEVEGFRISLIMRLSGKGDIQ